MTVKFPAHVQNVTVLDLITYMNVVSVTDGSMSLGHGELNVVSVTDGSMSLGHGELNVVSVTDGSMSLGHGELNVVSVTDGSMSLGHGASSGCGCRWPLSMEGSCE